MENRGKVYAHLLDGAGSMADALGGLGALAAKLGESKNKLLFSIGLALTHFSSALNEAARQGGDKLRTANEEALARKDSLRATLTGFQMDLERGEEEQVFLRSRR